jgi:hypothetical protein
MTTFRPFPIKDGSHKLGEAHVSEDAITAKCGNGEGPYEKVAREWRGIMTANDGTEVAVACWDWKGSLSDPKPYVSIWAADTVYLLEWLNFLVA